MRDYNAKFQNPSSSPNHNSLQRETGRKESQVLEKALACLASHRSIMPGRTNVWKPAKA